MSYVDSKNRRPKSKNGERITYLQSTVKCRVELKQRGDTWKQKTKLHLLWNWGKLGLMQWQFGHQYINSAVKHNWRSFQSCIVERADFLKNLRNVWRSSFVGKKKKPKYSPQPDVDLLTSLHNQWLSCNYVNSSILIVMPNMSMSNTKETKQKKKGKFQKPPLWFQIFSL